MKLITGTDHKILSGVFEVDMKYWVRQYNFTLWEDYFKEEGSPEKYGLMLIDL